MLAKLFRRRSADEVVTGLYRSLVEKARDPAFYLALGVPDTVDGRFDMIVMHTMLMLRRLRGQGETAEILGQQLFDLMFKDMDRSLRELGVGDMSVGKHIKRMAQAFYGRAEQYELGLNAAGDGVLTAALMENVYRRGAPQPAQLAAMESYLHRIDRHLAAQDVAALIAGRVDFAVPVTHGAQDQRP